MSNQSLPHGTVYLLISSSFILYFCLFKDDFFLGKCFEAMEVDSLSSSHPVSTDVENPTQIQEMFDDVSYDKVSLNQRTNCLVFQVISKLIKKYFCIWSLVHFQRVCVLFRGHVF